jgi:Carboxypeptidase regulatory-like domain
MIAPVQVHRLAAACLGLLLAGIPAALAEGPPVDSQSASAADPAAAAAQKALAELSELEGLLDAHDQRSTKPFDEEARELIEQKLVHLRRLAEVATATGPLSTSPSAGSGDLLGRIESVANRLRRGPKGRTGGARAIRTAGPTPAAPPANDTCATATPIGEGTFFGDTSEAGSDGDSTCGDSSASPDAWFAYTPSASGTAFFNTFDSDYDTALSVHSACPGTTGNELDCNDDANGGTLQSEIEMSVTSGVTVYLRVTGWDGAAGPYVLTAGLPGSISGTVTEAGSGDPITGFGSGVTAYRAANGDVEFAGSGSTDGSGNYTIAGLAPGTYRVIARGATQVNELYDDIPCPWGLINACFPERGAEVVVTTGADTPGIDFALAPGGSISGTVTAASGGAPLFGLSVDAFDISGSFVHNQITAGNGSYTLAGLPTGEYYLATNSAFPKADEIYDDIPCPGGGLSIACNIRTGKRVSVTAPADTPGIDFALPDGGSITGTVTEDPSGDPLNHLSVRVYNANGTAIDIKYSAMNGSYSFTGLHSGSYRVVTRFTDTHLDELYDDIVCYHSLCSLPDGDPVTVIAPAETSGIDLALAMGGSISGTVTDDPGGSPLEAVDVEVYDATGDLFLSSASTAPDGTYTVEGLPPGSHRVSTYGAAPLADELFDDLPCPGGWCNAAPGAEVVVSGTSDTGSIDFALAAAGAISGTVTEAGSGTPLAGIEVEVYDTAGDYHGFDITGGDGTYTITGLPTGSYHVDTYDSPAHIDELYDNIACPGAGCDPTTGGTVSVITPSTTSGIDFALATGGTIEGTVTDAVTGLPVRGSVTIFDAAGSFLYDALVDGVGHFTSSIGLPTGTYYARTDTLGGFLERRFGSVSCVGSCDPVLSSPIAVTSPSTTMGVDFSIYQPGADDTLVLSYEDLDAAASVCSEGTITLGPDFGLVGSANLQVLAAGSVVFPSGFSSASGTTLVVALDPAATCP